MLYKTLMLCLVQLAIYSININCEPSWRSMDGLSNEYFASGKELYFQGAKVLCSTIGAHIVQIESQQENDFVTTLAQSEHSWLNAKNPGKVSGDSTSRNYVWLDDTEMYYSN